jgi:Phosphotransferase enzyme family
MADVRTVAEINEEYLTPIAAKMLGDMSVQVIGFRMVSDPFEFPRFGEKEFYEIPFGYAADGRRGKSTLILRVMPEMDAVMMLTGDTEHRELKAFEEGLLAQIPETFRIPYVHAVCRPEHGQYWAFLEDVRPAMQELGMHEKCSDADVRTILSGLAALHAKFWERRDIIDQPWLFSLRRGVDYFYRTIVDILDGMKAAAESSVYITERWPWLAEGVVNMMDSLPADTREAIEGGYRNPEALLRQIEDMPMTLCHYDFDNRNLGIEVGPSGRRAVVIDWEILGKGVSASDVVRFMMYHQPENLAELQEYYLDELERQLGEKVDRAEWHRAYEIGSVAEWQIRGVLFAVMVNAPSAPVPDEMREPMKERVFSDIGAVESLIRKHGLA